MNYDKPPLQHFQYPLSNKPSPSKKKTSLLIQSKDELHPLFKIALDQEQSAALIPNNNNGNNAERYQRKRSSTMRPYEDRVPQSSLFVSERNREEADEDSIPCASASSSKMLKYRIKEGGRTVFGATYWRQCHQSRTLPVQSIWNHELELKNHLYVESDRMLRATDWEPLFKSLKSTEKGGGADDLKAIWIGSVWMDAWRYKEYLEFVKQGKAQSSGSINLSKSSSTSKNSVDWDEKMAAILANQRLVHLTSSIPALCSSQLQVKMAKALGDAMRASPHLTTLMLCGLGSLSLGFLQTLARSISGSAGFSGELDISGLKQVLEQNHQATSGGKSHQSCSTKSLNRSFSISAPLPPSSTVASRIVNLSLCRCEIGDEGFKKLLPCIKNSGTLRWLDLSQCQLTDASGDLLIDLIRVQAIKFHSNAWQRSLRSSESTLGKEDDRRFVPKLEAGVIGLQRLNLCCNGLTDNFLKQFWDLLAEPILLHALDLQFNNFSGRYLKKEFVEELLFKRDPNSFDLLLLDLRNNRGLIPDINGTSNSANSNNQDLVTRLMKLFDDKRNMLEARFGSLPNWKWLSPIDPLEYSYWAYKPSLFEKESEKAVLLFQSSSKNSTNSKKSSKKASVVVPRRAKPAWRPASFHPNLLPNGIISNISPESKGQIRHKSLNRNLTVLTPNEDDPAYYGTKGLREAQEKRQFVERIKDNTSNFEERQEENNLGKKCHEHQYIIEQSNQEQHYIIEQNNHEQHFIIEQRNIHAEKSPVKVKTESIPPVLDTNLQIPIASIPKIIPKLSSPKHSIYKSLINGGTSSNSDSKIFSGKKVGEQSFMQLWLE